MRGLSTALVDASDFGASTSANSLKVIHGGLRHLQHGDLVELRACALERATWLRIAPHLVQPMPVVLPLFGSRVEPLLFKTALAINDGLTFDRNRDLPPGQDIPDSRLISKAECVDRLPALDVRKLRCGVLYHDAKMYSSERLVLAVVRSAVEAGAVAANHVECVGPLLEGERCVGIEVLDRLDDSRHALRARAVINAAGPGAAQVEERLRGRPSRRDLHFSLAWNLVLRSDGLSTAYGLPGADATPTGNGGHRPRRLFFVPWRDRTLVGTGHAVHSDDPRVFDGMDVDHPALREFIDELNASWFGDPVRSEDILMVHAGLLPAHPARGEDVRLRRRPTLRESDVGGMPVVTANTVKFTAGRRVAEQATDRVCQILRHQAACRTATTVLPGAPVGGMQGLLSEAKSKLVAKLDADVIEHLARSYGTDFARILVDAGPSLLTRVSDDAPVIAAQWVHAIREEMATSVEDLLARRTELGARGLVDAALRDRAEEILAAHSAEVRS
jgi:glycerol-3-phosphate dehydrogenase